MDKIDTILLQHQYALTLDQQVNEISQKITDLKKTAEKLQYVLSQGRSGKEQLVLCAHRIKRLRQERSILIASRNNLSIERFSVFAVSALLPVLNTLINTVEIDTYRSFFDNGFVGIVKEGLDIGKTPFGTEDAYLMGRTWKATKQHPLDSFFVQYSKLFKEPIQSYTLTPCSNDPHFDYVDRFIQFMIDKRMNDQVVTVTALDMHTMLSSFIANQRLSDNFVYQKAPTSM